jgi:hypothetical protein
MLLKSTELRVKPPLPRVKLPGWKLVMFGMPSVFWTYPTIFTTPARELMFDTSVVEKVEVEDDV